VFARPCRGELVMVAEDDNVPTEAAGEDEAAASDTGGQ
jgi:hypothetical protein